MQYLSIMLAFGKDVKQLNNFVKKNLISSKSAKNKQVFLCFISTDSTDWSVCCSSHKLSWVHSQFLPRSLKAERADGVVGINTRLDGCRQTQRDRQQNKSTVFKTTSVGSRQKRGSQPHIPHWPWLQNQLMLMTLIITGSSVSSVLI